MRVEPESFGCFLLVCTSRVIEYCVLATSHYAASLFFGVIFHIFRKFWGPRCDVRRFQDGRMLHCVLWEKFVALEGPAALERGAEGAVGAQSPPEQITRAVLERHAAGICEYSATLTKTELSATPKRQKHRRAFNILCSPLGSNGPLSERQKALIRVGYSAM